MRIKFYTNAQKSQFRDMKNGNWQILGIPITVDDAVMNGILYEKADNAVGLASYRGQPVTLRHPEDENGNGISAMSGKAMMDNFSGGVITNTYNHNGINYADAEFKEKMMLAQDNGDYYVNRLKAGESIGISTGLFFDGNNQSGVAANGEEYHAKAINQIGDHVAMLPNEEPPAGGAATFIKFNGKNDEQTLTINIDDMLANINNVDVLIDEIATNDEEKGLLSRFFARCKQAFASNEKPCDNDNLDELLTNNKEGDAMREAVENELKAKGIAFNASDTDAVLLGLLSKQPEVADPTAAINAAVKSALAPLTETVTALQTQITANSDKELDALAAQAAPFMDCEVDDAKKLGVNALHKVLAKNGVVVGAPNAANHKSPEDKSGSGISTEPWNDKGAK